MLQTAQHDSLHYHLNEARAMAWKAKGNRDSMMTYLYRNYERALLLENKEMQAASLKNIVRNSKYIYDNVAYVRMLQELIGLYRQLNRPYDQAKIQCKFGELPSNLVGLPEVQKNLFEALAIFDSLGDGKMKVLANLRIGNVFWEIGSTDKAKKYYDQALIQAYQLQDTINLINVYNNIGLLHRNINPDSALICYTKSVALAKNYPDQRNPAWYNLANIYFDQRVFERARPIYLKLLDEAIREENLEGMAYACSGLFSLSVETGAFEAAIQYSTQAIDAAVRLKDEHLRQMLLNDLYQLFKDKRQWQQALAIGEEINTIRDSLYTLDKQAAIHELEISYQSARKELENKQLRIGLETQQRLNTYTIAVNLMLGLGLLIFAGMYLYIRALYRQRTNAYHVLMAHFKKEKTEKKEQESPVNTPTGQGIILDKIGHRLGRYMEQDKPFLDPNLKVDVVLDKLKISQRQLTLVLKQLGFSNFSNFVNHYRVVESRKMLEREEFDIYTIEAIAEKAGFGTKQSFYNAFEQQTGVKPMYYRQSMRRDV